MPLIYRPVVIYSGQARDTFVKRRFWLIGSSKSPALPKNVNQLRIVVGDKGTSSLYEGALVWNRFLSMQAYFAPLLTFCPA